MVVINVDSFAFTYPGAERPAVRDVSFHVESGEIFGFLGPSGAGKSTTQNVLIRLLDGYEGRSPSWARICATGIESYYRRIGVAFEAPNHYLKLTARENLQLFAGLHGGGTEDPDALLTRVGLEQDADKRGRGVLERHAWPSDIRARAFAPTWTPVPGRTDRRARSRDRAQDSPGDPRGP